MEIKDFNDIKSAQTEMRENHLLGATGIVVSGLMWFISSLVAYNYSVKQAVWTLLIGGVLISPISTLFNKLIGIGRTQSKNNPLISLTMEGTIFMIMCIPLAYGLSLVHIEWFFQGMLMIIGGRYLTFNTIYGSRLFWFLGGALGIASYLLFSLNVSAYLSALIGAGIEIIFGVFAYFIARKVIIIRS